MYPREAEIVLKRIVDCAAAVQLNLQYLEDPCHSKTAEESREGLDRAIHTVRTIWFESRRAYALIQEDTAVLRKIYEESIDAVNAVRANGVIGDPLDPIANIQEAVRDLFPDHELVTEYN